MNLFQELQRRNVFRVGIAYVVASWVFLQVADLVLDAINAPDWVLQALMLLIGLGLVAAVIIAWAYEITPEGIKREKDIQRGESITYETANKLNRLTIVLLVVAVVIVVADRLVPESGPAREVQPASATKPVAQEETEQAAAQYEPSPEKPAAEKSVAVLPFVNMSSDPEQEFFSDGISEEILNVLTRIPGLKVAARTSSFQFKGRNLDIDEIARQLKVNHVLEGSVRKAGDRLRITAQLIEAESGFHLWSDSFDRQLEDVFAIQDEIANAIATELRTRLAEQPLAASTPVDMAAYDLYLKGRALVSTRRESNLLQAIELLKESLEIAPDYAPAMASMAKAYVVLPWFSQAIPVGEARAEARRWAQAALDIQPNNTEALSVMGIVYNEVDLDPEKALQALQRAAEANPGSAVAHNFLGDIYTRIADLDNALVHEARAAELDPLGPIMLTDLANVYMLKGDLRKVVEMANRALELDPEFQNALIHLTDVYFMLGDHENFEITAQRMFRASDIRGGDLDGVRMQRLLLNGELEEARALFEAQLEKVQRGELDPAWLSFNAVLLGDFDAAGRLLQLAYAQGDGTWAFPIWVRLPEQAPDSEPWQDFWRLPGPDRFAELRQENGFGPHPPGLERYRKLQ